MSNNVNTQFPNGVKVCVQALANAAIEQVVTITPPAGKPAIFKGSGENNTPLQLIDSGFLTVLSGQPFFVAAGGQNYNVRITHDKALPNTVQDSQLVVSTPANSRYGITSVISEDSRDSDYDDGVVIMTWSQR